MCILISLDEYKTGHEEIDRQHYFLFELANRIIQANNQQTAMKLGNMLFHYLDDYFKTEEAIMQHYCYPSYTAHVLEHKQLLKELVEILDCSENGLWSPNDFIDFIRTQLLVHIIEKDMKLC